MTCWVRSGHSSCSGHWASPATTPTGSGAAAGVAAPVGRGGFEGRDGVSCREGCPLLFAERVGDLPPMAIAVIVGPLPQDRSAATCEGHPLPPCSPPGYPCSCGGRVNREGR